MSEFVRTRFYDLAEDADIMAAFEEFAQEHEKAEMEEFAFSHGIEFATVNDIMVEFIFNGSISDESIRKRLMAYHLGLLKITKLTKEIKDFVGQTYMKYKAEGE